MGNIKVVTGITEPRPAEDENEFHRAEDFCTQATGGPVNWVNMVIRWCERLMPVNGSFNQTTMLILFVFGIVLFGAWVKSRLAQ